MKTPHWSAMSQDRLNCCALMSIENDILREIDFTGIITEFASEPSIKYVMLFFANFDPLPLSHCVTHPETPQKSTSHISDAPDFSRPSTKNRTKTPCTNSLLIVRGVFVQGALSGVVFVHSPFCQNTSVTTER